MKYTPSQSKAIHHEGENILVSASAGSGKTGVLKARVLRKLKDGKNIDDLIVLTFTEGAAKEMKSRIIEELKANHLEDQMVKLDNAIISTFDSFTLRMVRAYHYLLDLPADISISDSLLIEMESQKVLEDIIKSYYLKNDDDFRQVVKLLFSGNDRFLSQAILNLAKAIKKIPNHMNLINNYHEIFNENTIEVAYQEYFSMLKQELGIIRDFFSQYRNDNYHQFSEDCDLYLDQCMAIYDELANASQPEEIISLVNAFKLPRKPTKPKNADEWLETHQASKKMIASIQKEFNEIDISKGIDPWIETKPRVQCLLNMTKDYLQAMKDVQHQLNLYSFDDIMNFAIELFENHEDIKESYKNRIDEILVDEYQDTNDLQDYLISLISNNNLFMVGDVKQSIYRFRDANPKNFLRLLNDYSHTQKGSAIRLLENFRSNRFLLKTINQLFLQLMTIHQGGVNYSDNHQLVSGFDDEFGLNQKNDPINFFYYDSKAILEKYEDLKKDDIEAWIIASDIKRKIEARQAIFDGKDFREIKYSDITILVDRKNAFSRYAKILSEHQIPVDIYDKQAFSESEEIIFINQYLKLLQSLIENNQDAFKKSFYSLARSFVYQIDDQDILNFLIHDKDPMNYYQAYDVFHRMDEDIKKILPLVNKVSNLKLIETIYQETNIYRQIALLDNPQSKSKKLDYFRHLISQQTEKDFFDLIAYLDFISENDSLDIEYKESRENVEAIKLMSIHQSKGLQFPVVYMLGLHKKFNFQENKDLFNFSPDYGVLTYANQDGLHRTFLEMLYFKRIKNEDISEKIRLLYVALTRAKEEVNFVIEAKESLNVEKIYYNNYLEMLYDGYNLQAKDIIYDLKALENKNQKNIEETNQTINYKQFDYKVETVDERRFSKSEHKLFDDQTKSALAYGDEIHQSLEQINYLDLEDSMSNLPSHIQKSIKYLSQTDLFKSLINPRFFKEYEFLDDVDGYMRSGIIDLLIEDDQSLIVIDYKLKNIDDQAYEKQINAYVNYLKKITDKQVKGYLYSLLKENLKQIV